MEPRAVKVAIRGQFVSIQDVSCTELNCGKMPKKKARVLM